MKLLTTLLTLLLASAPLLAQDSPCCQEKAAPAEAPAKSDCCAEGEQDAGDCSAAQKSALEILGKIAEANADRLYNIDYNMKMNMEQMGQPMAMDMNKKATSRESLTGLRKRMMDMAPTSAKARAMFEPMMTMIRAMVKPMNTIVWVKDEL